VPIYENLQQFSHKGQKFPGVFYREHQNRKYGIRKDRQLILRYSINGKRRIEVFGWLSQAMPAPDDDKKFSPEIALHKIKTYRSNMALGIKPTSWTEEKALQLEKTVREKKKKEEEKQLAIRTHTTFSEYWQDHYLPYIKNSKKTQSWKTERSLYKIWINPILGQLKLTEISPFHIRIIHKRMSDAKKSKSTVRMAYFVVQQLWNLAVSDKYVSGPSPTKDKQANMPTKKALNNERERYLTLDEAKSLLNALNEKSEKLHDICLLALHTGMRASEIFNLKWEDIDFTDEIIRLLETKTRSPRTVPLTRAAFEMLQKRSKKSSSKLVFPGRRDKASAWVSHTFARTVIELKLNQGVTDRRRKVVFHSLRHTCASYLIQNNVDILTVSKILGHSSLEMTKRYAHLNDQKTKESIEKIGNLFM